MNLTRLAMLLTGMTLVLIAGAVAYFQTDLRNYVPLGVALAVLLLIGGLFVIALAAQFRSSRVIDDRIVERRAAPIVPATTTNTTIVRDRDRPSRRYVEDRYADDRDVTEIDTIRTH